MALAYLARAFVTCDVRTNQRWALRILEAMAHDLQNGFVDDG